MVETLSHKLAFLSVGESPFVIACAYLALLMATLRRRGLAVLFGALGLAWLSFYGAVYDYVGSLSSDSFIEAHHFDLDEARFWLLTMREELHADLNWKKLAFYLAVALALFYLPRLLQRRPAPPARPAYLQARVLLALAMMGWSTHHLAAQAVSDFLENSDAMASAARNFDHPPPPLPPARHGLDLVVYIGESTSVMHMGLYGYPRDTTPRLSRLARQDDSLLVFRHVFSTHVYTSQSLLEALSFGIDPQEDALPIARRRRIPLPDVLMRAGVDTRIVSNQGLRGAFEMAGSIIFGRVPDATFRMLRDVQARRDEQPPPSRWDHEFFAAQLARDVPRASRPRVTFLHSYAGHGPYLDNIPPDFRTPVDNLLADLPRELVTGDRHQSATHAWGLEEYDSAMRYVDHSVAQSIEHVRGQRQPAVLLYFADHGESPFTGVGHDAARFRHEMVRVPFLLYFNEAARRAYPDLYKRYRRLSRTGEIATLAQLPSTLLDLLGIEATTGLRRTALVGERTVLPPIVVREQAGRFSYMNLNIRRADLVLPASLPLVDSTDPDIRRFVAWHAGRAQPGDACAGVPGSFEELSRRVLLAGCHDGVELLGALLQAHPALPRKVAIKPPLAHPPAISP